MRTLLALSAVLLLPALVWADKVEFSTPPEVTRDGDAFVLTFAVNRATDVEIAVLDAKDRVVRHLAAGVLDGKNPPPAPLQKGLRQRLSWDGKDDQGKVAEGAPFRFRVRAGTGVKLGRFIGGSPYTGGVVQMPYRAPVNGLAVDGEGNLLALMMSAVGSHGNSGLWPWHLRKFDSKGDYLRTLLPYPPSTKPGEASGFKLLDTPDGFTPANRTSLYPVFVALGNEILPRLHDGQLVFVHTEKRELNFFSLDGRNRLKTVPLWSAQAKLNLPIWMDIQAALSPDGKYAYLSNVAGVPYDGRVPANIDPKWPQGRVYRLDLSKPGSEPEPFFDLTLPDFDKEKYWMPSAWDKKSAAAGIDTDARGNVLLCDLVNHRVVEIDPAGKQRSSVAVSWPDRVLASRKGDGFYVITRKVSRGYLPPATLYKINGRGDSAKVVAQLALKGTVGGAATLDESGQTPVLWLAGVDNEKGKLIRVEDRGDKLVIAGEDYLNRDDKAIDFVGYMDVDRAAELVYVTRSGGTVWRYQGETGEGGVLPIRAVDLAIGPGGHVYTWGTSGSYQGPIARYTRDLKPAPLDGDKRHTFGAAYGRAGRGSSVCGMDVDGRGRVYLTWGSNDCHVRVYDEKGELVEYPRKEKAREGEKQDTPAAISGVTGYGGSIRVDTAGNLYLLQAGVPKDFPAPPGFEKDEGFRQAVGTIYKFPPAGGEVKNRNGVVQEVIGATAKYPGCGPVSRWNAVGSCACTKPRFDVDDYGRLYIPNAVTFSVSLRDNSGNEIVSFGAYGNYDCQGAGSKETSPAIPLGWPITAGASERFIYVGDCLNHRVVRVDRQYAVEKIVGAAR